jgi:hypothetical protein
MRMVTGSNNLGRWSLLYESGIIFGHHVNEAYRLLCLGISRSRCGYGGQRPVCGTIWLQPD